MRVRATSGVAPPTSTATAGSAYEYQLPSNIGIGDEHEVMVEFERRRRQH